MIKVKNGKVEFNFSFKAEMEADAVVCLVAIRDEAEKKYGKEAAEALMERIFKSYKEVSVLSEEEEIEEKCEKAMREATLKFLTAILSGGNN